MKLANLERLVAGERYEFTFRIAVTMIACEAECDAEGEEDDDVDSLLSNWTKPSESWAVTAYTPEVVSVLTIISCSASHKRRVY